MERRTSLAKTRRVLETSDNHKKVATEVATLDGHPLTDQRMPSLANAKFKIFFDFKTVPCASICKTRIIFH